MSQRETKEITIGKHKLVIKTYATAREINKLRQAGMTDGNVKPEHEEILIAEMVVSVNGSTENVIDTILDTFEFENEYVPLMSEVADCISKKK